MNIRFNVGILLVLSVFIQPSTAAQDWLKKGKELLANTKTESNVNLSEQDLNAGLKEALSLGTQAVVNKLSIKDSYLNDKNIHIPLPSSLKKVEKVLAKIGYSELTKNLETKLNHAAELAVPEAQSIFLHAIKNIKIEDLKSIYNGSDDAATQYLRKKMSQPLTTAFKPIVNEQLETVGALKLYDQAINKYKSVPFVPDIKQDLNQHVINKSLDGLFYYLAIEESKIRNDPMKQSTELLKKLFSN